MDNFGCSPSQVRTFTLSLLKYKALAIYDLTMTDRINATEHMKQFNLDFHDASAYEAMKATGTTEIVSMDKHFDKIPDIRRTEPKA